MKDKTQLRHLASGHLAADLHEMYETLDKGFKCAACGKRVRKGGKFWILSQPMCYPRRDENVRYEIHCQAVCLECGQHVYDKIKERWGIE